MNSYSSFVLAIIASIYVSQCQGFGVFSIGNCPEIPDKPEFLINSYYGSWYGYANSFNTFQFGTKCAKAEYAQALNETGSPIKNRISVRNTGVYSLFPTVKTEAKGFAEPFDERVPNKLRLKLKPQFLGMEIDTDNEGKYFVLATDYINYSVVYSCYETNYVFFSVKEEFSFILTRSKKPTDATVAIAKSQLSRFSDPANLLLTEQDCDN